MARPRKTLTEDQKAQVEALAAFLSQDQIADYFGMSRPTLSRILDDEESVYLRYKRGKASAIADVAGGLLKKAREGDMGAICFYLKTQAGWRETQKLDHTSSDGSMKQTTVVVLPAKADAGD